MEQSDTGRAAPGSTVPGLVASLLAKAAHLHRMAAGEEEYEAIWPVLDEARGFGRDAFDAATGLLDSDDPSARAVACDLLGALCNPDEQGWSPDAASILIALAEHEADSDVLWSMAAALGHTHDHRAVTTLVRLAGHSDSDVRYHVAHSLPSCRAGADPEVLSQALMGLMDDADERIRDWATFGLGTLTDIDGPDLREAFLRRLGDECPEARDEATVALARRRDARVLPVVAACLGEEDVGRLAVEAAAFLGDERLLEPLQALAGWWDVDPGLLDEALASCDPGRRAAALDHQTAFLAALETGLVEWPGVAAWLSCERFARDVSVEIEQGGRIGCYDFETLLGARAGGDVQVAVAAVLSDLRRARRRKPTFSSAPNVGRRRPLRSPGVRRCGRTPLPASHGLAGRVPKVPAGGRRRRCDPLTPSGP